MTMPSRTLRPGARAPSGSLPGIRAEEAVELALLRLHGVGVGHRIDLPGDVRPLLRVLPVELEPFLGLGLGVRQDRLGRAFRLAHTAVDTFIRRSEEHTSELQSLMRISSAVF